MRLNDLVFFSEKCRRRRAIEFQINRLCARGLHLVRYIGEFVVFASQFLLLLISLLRF